MDKKVLLGIGLAVATGGIGLIGLAAFKTVRKVKVHKKRKQLKKYVKKYLGGNEKALAVVDGLSNFEVRILFKIFEKTIEKVGEVKVPGAISNKISALVEG